MQTSEGEAAREQRFNTGKERYEALLKKAKDAGVPGVRSMMKTETIKQKMRAHGIAVDSISMDKSLRTFSEDGHLHVEMVNFSKASINEYLGNEITRWDELGLDPGRIYRMLRPAEEMEKAQGTFTGKPLLIKHKPVNSNDPAKELIVGSVGECEFKSPYLCAPLAVWDAEAITGIEDGSRAELSAGYHYDALMEPGTFEGQNYDGQMVNIRGNHIALVPRGRAGRDCFVSNSDPQPLSNLEKTMDENNPTAPVENTANDSDLLSFLQSILTPEQLEQAKSLMAAPAEDESLEPNNAVPAVPTPPIAKDDVPGAAGVAGGEGKSTTITIASDAAINAQVTAAVSAVEAKFKALDQARNAVRPHVGELMGCDTAEAVYKHALKQFNVPAEGIPLAGLAAMWSAIPKTKTEAPIAMDAASIDATSKAFPHLDRVSRSY